MEEAWEALAAGIEYHGNPDGSQECLTAIERLLAYKNEIKSCIILTHRRDDRVSEHAMILTNSFGDKLGIKAGFASGYGGKGPRDFSETLRLLHWHKVELEEVDVSPHVLGRLGKSSLSVADLEFIERSRPVRPKRLWHYIVGDDQKCGNPWIGKEPVIPLALFDERLATVARDFWEDPDGLLLKAHRQLEDIIANRIGADEKIRTKGPAAVFSFAFNGEIPRLTWPETTRAEHDGIANIFIGTTKAFRNPRAHQQRSEDRYLQLQELLLLNHLFSLEGRACFKFSA